MAPDSFHLFTSLPFELRWDIYLLATPPRFVHLQEKRGDREEFEEWVSTTPVQFKLHPSIAYFARNWRHYIPFYSRMSRQLTLDAFGLVGPPPRHQPWEPTEEVPDIPHHFLSEHPRATWEFMRSGSFYSRAPIPALLHVSIESRQVLMDSGYELAFRTRTCGPCTWFNFETDILYLEWDDDDNSINGRQSHSLLSGNNTWDIGQFDPQDLRRVRRLALEAGAQAASPDDQGGASSVSSILHLFGGVEELFLEEHEMTYGDTFPRTRCHEDIERLWCHMPPQEVDILAYTFDRENLVSSAGIGHYYLKNYKTENMGDASGYFDHTAREFEKKLASKRDEYVLRDKLIPWEIPKVNIVYITYPSICRKLSKWRWETWYELQGMQEEDARDRAAEEAIRSIDVPRRMIYQGESRPQSPYSAQFWEDEEVLHEQRMDEEYSHSIYDADDMRHWYRIPHERLMGIDIMPPPEP
ncbi:hypothetical protein F5Y10DRAFT_273030 [Nemania abortiva]|nr:hypothetical protein F5Y10DRAFT_273030 [Nemania abortiva]